MANVERSELQQAICDDGLQVNQILAMGKYVPEEMQQRVYSNRVAYWLVEEHETLAQRAGHWVEQAENSIRVGQALGDRRGLIRDVFWLENSHAIMSAAGLSEHSEKAKELLHEASNLLAELPEPDDTTQATVLEVVESPEEYTKATGNKIWKWSFAVPTRNGLAPVEAVMTAIHITDKPENRKGTLCIPLSVGCPAGCRMCQVGETYIQPLTADQMVTIVERVSRSYSHPSLYPQKMKYSWLGGGDPAFNFDQFEKAARTVHDLHPESQQVVSTVGVNEQSLLNLLGLSSKLENMSIQVSLLNLDEQRRQQIIGKKNVLSPKSALSILQSYWQETGIRPYISLMLFDGMDSSPKDIIEQLQKFSLDPRSIHITLDRPPTVSDTSLKVAPISQYEEVQHLLRESGFDTHIYSVPEYEYMESGCGILLPKTREQLLTISSTRRPRTLLTG